MTDEGIHTWSRVFVYLFQKNEWELCQSFVKKTPVFEAGAHAELCPSFSFVFFQLHNFFADKSSSNPT